MKGVWGTAVVAGLGVLLIGLAPNASAQDGCSCTQKDPAAAVTLRITAANPREHSRIGRDLETLVVDLRGERTELVGDRPPLLEDVDLSQVPVLMAADDGSSDDPCSSAQPAAGTNLSLTGQTYLEDTGPVVWTGTCQGTLTIEAAAPELVPTEEDPWARGITISIVVLAGLAVLCLALVPVPARRRDRTASESKGA